MADLILHYVKLLKETHMTEVDSLQRALHQNTAGVARLRDELRVLQAGVNIGKGLTLNDKGQWV